MQQLYKVRESKSRWEPLKLSELLKAKFARSLVNTDMVDSPGEWEWYCENPRCAVREVRVHVKREILQKLKCPNCRKNLKLHGRIEEEILVVAGTEADTKQQV